MTNLCTEVGVCFASVADFGLAQIVVYVPHAVKVWHKVKSLQEDILVFIV